MTVISNLKDPQRDDLMSGKPEFTADAHRFFSAYCFNSAWQLIEKPDRTPEDDEQMIRLTHAATWHWTQRPDCTARNLSIGYWQTARIYALAGESDNARKYARLCLEVTPEDDEFCLGYAYEALARAESVAGNDDSMNQHLADAWRHAEQVPDEQDRQLLVDDLNSLGAASGA